MIHRYIIEVTDEVKGFDEAIEKLDREWGIEELEPCEDAISRLEVRDLLATWLTDNLTEETWETLETIDGKVEDMQSVIPKTKPCEDCISRQEAIKEFQVYREYSSNRSNSDWVDRIEAVLMDLPSVTPKASEDCISREAIYEALSEWDEQDVYLPYHFKELVDELPPVTPKAEPCDDAISRKDAVDIINGYAEQFNGYIGTPNDTEVYAYARGLLLSIERNISALPSVIPKEESESDD